MLIIYCIALLFPYFYGTTIGVIFPRQSPGSYYAVTGAVGGVHPRLEIRELQRNPIMWNLFLLALTNFQDLDQTQTDSYYQIAGIHGMPWYDWDNVTFNPSHGTPPKVGYCPHHDLLFATWHRPFILLFEQKLQAVAIEIAKDFGDPSYRDAAIRLRLPFWDWALAVPVGEPVFPVALSAATVFVTLRGGEVEERRNPLGAYVFHPLDRGEINSTACSFSQNAPICDNSVGTVRRAVRSSSGEFNSNYTAIEVDLRSQLTGLRQMVYSLITQYHSFNDLSNDGNCGNSAVPSVEAPHNNIHNAMDPGHMSPLATSAFDPLFWLHHANVDRQIALFQSLFPTTYIEQCSALHTTWTTHRGDALDAQSPLKPFHRTASGTWWTSSSVRYTPNLGYTYPELLDGPTNETLIARINALYRDTHLAAKNTDGISTVGRMEREYLIQVTMPASPLSSYNVVLFAGDIPVDPLAWSLHPSFLGKTASRIDMGGRGTVTVGTVVVTRVVEEMEGGEVGMGEEGVVGYLKSVLQWRLELGGVEIPKGKVAGVRIELMSTEVERAGEETELDRWVGGVRSLGRVE